MLLTGQPGTPGSPGSTGSVYQPSYQKPSTGNQYGSPSPYPAGGPGNYPYWKNVGLYW